MGCGAPPIPEEATGCPTTFPDDFPETRDVAAGPGPAETFVPYADGDVVEGVIGGQGSFMITPTVRVAAAPGDAVEACFRVFLINEIQGVDNGPDGPDALQSNVQFLRQGDYLFSDGALYNPFSSPREDLTGATNDLTLKVQGTGFQGTQTVQIILK